MRTGLLTGAGIVLLSVFLILFFLNISNTVVKRNYSDYLENFASGTQLTLSYNAKKELLYPERIFDKQEKIIFPLKDNSILHAQKYTVSYSFKNTGNQYTDIFLILDKHTKTISSQFKGLPTETKISAVFNNEEKERLVPVDWAGSIYFEHNYQEQNTEFCFLIEHKTVSKLCHVTSDHKEALS